MEGRQTVSHRKCLLRERVYSLKQVQTVKVRCLAGLTRSYRSAPLTLWIMNMKLNRIQISMIVRSQTTIVQQSPSLTLSNSIQPIPSFHWNQSCKSMGNPMPSWRKKRPQGRITAVLILKINLCFSLQSRLDEGDFIHRWKMRLSSTLRIRL